MTDSVPRHATQFCHWPGLLGSRALALSAVVAVAALCFGCFYYDYAVDTQTTKVEHPSYYQTERNRRFDFNTVLFTTDTIDVLGNNYNDFTISVSHLAWKKDARTSEKFYRSELRFTDFRATDSITLLADAISILHTTMSGDTISPFRISSDLEREREGTWRHHSVWRDYRPRDLEKVVNEQIRASFVLGKDTVTVSKTFRVERKYHYSFWDIMMGI